MNLIRIAYLQSLWFLFIYSAGSSWSMFTPLIALTVICLDKYIFYKELDLKKFIYFTLKVFFIGFVLDNIIIKLGLMSFKYTQLSPPYLWSIWLIFVPYFQFAFNRFYDKLWAAAILGAIFAPLSYQGGAKIADLTINGNAGIIAIAIGWAIVFPILVWVHRKLFFNKAEQNHPQ